MVKAAYFLSLFILLGSCVKYHINGESQERPLKNNIFKYRKRSDAAINVQIVDTNALYVHSGGPLSTDGIYEYVRFFKNGQVLYFVDKGVQVENANKLTKGSIGYYYIKNNKVRIEIFGVSYGAFGGLHKTFGYFKNDTLFSFQQTPETFCSSYGLTKLFSKNSLCTWVKTNPPNMVALTPDW